MKPFTDMAPDTWARIAKLPDERRDRVLERSCILIAEGLPPQAADERALLEEAGLTTQQRMVGT